MNTLVIERNILKTDNDGNLYSIPPQIEQQFIRMCEDIQNEEFLSSDWEDTVHEFNVTYSKYLKD